MTDEGRGGRSSGRRGRGNSGPPPSVRQTAPPPVAKDREGPTSRPAEVVGPERRFTVGDQTWIARTVGSSLYGAGLASPARLDVVSFRRADDVQPSHEILIPGGRFELLHETELRELLDRSTRLDSGGEGGRGGRRER